MFFSLKFKSGVFGEGKMFRANCCPGFSFHTLRTGFRFSTLVKSCNYSQEWGFHFEEKHAAGYSIPTTAAAEVALLHASKTSEDQSVVLWELQGPNSPTDIVLNAFLHVIHIHTQYTQMHSTITTSSDLRPPWLKSVSLLTARLFFFFFFFSVPSVINSPALT